MQQFVRFIFTVCLGALGGTVFYLAGLPLPWMLGSMFTVAAIAVAGAPVVSVKKFRPPLMAIIGVTLGSAFTPETFARIPDWWPLTVATFASTLLMGGAGFLYLNKIAKYDPITAYFAAMPAGVYEMTYQGGLLGGDERRIALTHAVRIFLVVMIVPIAFRWLFDLGPALAGARRSSGIELEIYDAVILLLCVGLGWSVAKLLRFPNPPMIGPLLASATVHGLGLIQTAPPMELVSVAQVLLGASIGGQFIGARLIDLRRTAAHGLLLVPLMLTFAVLIALITGRLSAVDFPTTLLSLSPGGLAEMSLIALALHIEVIAVVSHQILRVLAVQTLAVIVFKSVGNLRQRF